MTDSDDSYELPNNVFTFQNGSTTVCAKGPTVNSTNISCLSFRNNMSNFDMRQNFRRPRYAESAFDQRSMYSRRETSPMSLCSASGLQGRNLGPSYYHGGISSQRSMYNQRSRSPMSVRTNVSNVSAMDIVTAIVTNKFNREEWKDIKYAFYKKLKHRDRNRVRKRQNIRMFLKGTLNRSGGESGEQGSNSSISDDDCRSVRSYRTTGYKESKSYLRPTRSNLTDFRRTMQESNMYRDCTDSLRQNTFRSMVSVAQGNEESMQIRPQYNNSVTIQKDRFRNGFLLPSQRFNQSVASSTIPEKTNLLQRNIGDQFNTRNGNAYNKHRLEKNTNNNTDSEQEEIFSEKPYGNSLQSKKRGLDDNDICIPKKKRGRLSTSPKINAKSKGPVTKQTKTLSKGNGRSNDFVFAKPQFPSNKMGNFSNQVKGNQVKPSKLIQISKKLDSKSQQPSTDLSIPKVQQPAEEVVLKGPQNTKDANGKSQLQNSKSPQLTDTNIVSENNEWSNDSVFAKPQLPLRKSVTIKNQRKVIPNSTHPEKNLVRKLSQQSTDIPNSTIQQSIESCSTKCQNAKDINPKSTQPEEKSISNSQQLTEKLISKSRQPLDATDCTTVQILPQNDKMRDPHKDQSETTQHSTTDVSMRPSFIKRKLFTQKIDLAENKNSSSENLDANSPHTNIYSAIQKEKSKTRKLVASQSCLNRDIFGDDSNLLDLIHKIVPADRMNLTTATNRSEVQVNKSKPVHADKWDISRVIATCNNADDGSDTYTDEEIFKADELKKTEPQRKNYKNQNEVDKICAVVVERLQEQSIPLNKVNELDSPEERNECNKRNLYNCVKSFWDTDSDNENNFESRNYSTNGKCNQKESQGKGTLNPNQATKRTDKENTEPITNRTLPPTKSTLNKTATVKRNNKKPENTKYPKNKPATNKTAAIEKNNNTEVTTVPNTKSTEKLQDDDKSRRGVKAAKKPRDIAKTIKPVQTESDIHTTVKIKQIDILTNKCNIRTLNNNLVLENVGDTVQKVNNNSTFSLRPQRKARIKLCCVQSSETDKSLNDTSGNDSTVYRNLRSRVIDLSTSLSDKNTTLNKNVPNKNVKKNSCRNKVDNLGQSDISFTLTTDKTANKRPSRLRNNIGKVLMMTRQNDVSFSLTSDNSLNKTITNNKKSSVNSKTTRTSTKKVKESPKTNSLAKANKKGNLSKNSKSQVTKSKKLLK